MKPFHIFWHNINRKPIAIKSGFSFWAFLFPFLYPALKGYWRVALMYLCGSILLSIITLPITGDNQIVTFLISLSYSTFVGFDYADYAFLEQAKSEKTNYLGTEFADNYDHAEFLAFQKQSDSINKHS